MFRIWGRTFKDNHLINDYVAVIDMEDTRTHKVFKGLEEICHEFNIMQPIWLDKNVREFKLFSHTRFNKDNFTEENDFDYLELRILEED